MTLFGAFGRAFGLPRSPAPHLLLSNDPPSPIQIDHIRDAIAEAESESSLLRAKLAKKRSQKAGENDKMSITRYKLVYTENFIVQHQRVLSLIRQLPAEILEEIFLWYSTDQPYDPPWK